MAKTVHLRCDYCGDAIEDEQHVSIDALGREEISDPLRWWPVGEHVGDYHATLERPCFEWMWGRMLAVHGTAAASALENIPTTTAQKITRLRSKHLKGEAS